MLHSHSLFQLPHLARQMLLSCKKEALEMMGAGTACYQTEQTWYVLEGSCAELYSCRELTMFAVQVNEEPSAEAGEPSLFDGQSKRRKRKSNEQCAVLETASEGKISPCQTAEKVWGLAGCIWGGVGVTVGQQRASTARNTQVLQLAGSSDLAGKDLFPNRTAGLWRALLSWSAGKLPMEKETFPFHSKKK